MRYAPGSIQRYKSISASYRPCLIHAINQFLLFLSLSLSLSTISKPSHPVLVRYRMEGAVPGATVWYSYHQLAVAQRLAYFHSQIFNTHHQAVGYFCCLISKSPTPITNATSSGLKCFLIYVASISIPVCAPPHVHSFASSSTPHRSSPDQSTFGYCSLS